MTHNRAAADAALPPNRRAFFGSSLALASLVATTAMASVAAEPDAHLLALGAELDRMENEIRPFRAAYNDPNNGPEVEEPYERRDNAQTEVMEKIAAAPATSMAGLTVKVRALSYIYHDGFTADQLGFGATTDAKLIWSILFGLVQVSGTAVRS